MKTRACFAGRRRRAVGVAVALAAAAWALGVASPVDAQTSTVVLSGTRPPGTPAGITYATLDSSPRMNDAGQLAFTALLAGTGVTTTNDRGIWSGSPATLALVAREGSPAPGTPAGVNFLQFSSASGFDPLGRISLTSSLTGTGVTTGNDRGLWVSGASGLTLAAREGSAAPGAGAGVNFGDLTFILGPGDAGEVAFSAPLTGSGVTTGNDSGIWQGPPGALSLLLRKGGAAPGLPAGTTFADASPDRINAAGHVLFNATLAGTGIDTTNDSTLWRSGPGGLELVARQGSAAPGTPAGTNFGGSFLNRDLNDIGQVAFTGTLAGTGADSTNDSAIWRGLPGALSLVTREGNSAPGTGTGIVFSGFSIPALLNDAGQVVFTSRVDGPGVDGTNNFGIWRGAPPSRSAPAARS